MTTISTRIISVFQQLRHASVAYLLPLLMSLAISARVHALDFTYTISNNTVTITGYTGSGGAVTIPPTINGLPITSIGSYAFSNWSGLTSVTIPSSVTSIGDSAFSSCSGLTSVTIPGSVTRIEDWTFSDCTSLSNVTIPNSVTSIGYAAFSECYVLTDVTIPADVTSIGSYAFYWCTSLGSVTIPASVISIGSDAFAACSSLAAISVDSANTTYCSLDGVLYDKLKTSLITCPARKSGSFAIPRGVTSIGTYAFDLCTGLISVAIPNGVTSIGFAAFFGCSGLASVTIPASVTSIGSSVFSDCSGLTSVTIPARVTSIGDRAFFGCSGLASVTIPASVTSIGSSVFSGCDALTSITVDATNPNYSNADGVLYNKLKTTLMQCPAGKTGSFAIPSGVTSIGDDAFGGCFGLTSVTIPASVTGIGRSAFSNCTGLLSAAFFGNAPSMGGYDFCFLSDITFYFDFVTIYYINGKTGFTTPTWQGQPAVPLAASQEIVVSGGAGTALTDGGADIDFGNVYPGASLVRTFTVMNAGLLNLTGLAITKDGTQAADFAVGPLDTTLLAPGASTSFTVTFAPAALGTRSAAIHIASNDANENPFDISLTGNGLDPNLNVAVGIDLPGTPITPGGQAPWVWQSTTTHDGISAGQSGVISDNQSSAFTLTAAGPGTVSFWWKVSSVYGYDFLSFSIDGVEQSGKISGEVDWRQKSYSLTAGSHTLQWSYTKDNVGSFGADCGWVDQVSFVATGISPVVTSPTSASITGTTATLGGNVTSDGGPTVTARGVVYAPTATTSNPRLGGTGVTNVPGTGTTGVITVPVSGLTPGTAYTFAAYATNSIGTSYSVTGSFTTLSNNDNLSNLALSSGTLSPAFASGTLAYSTGVSNASASLTVTPTAAQANAIIMVNGTSVASGSASSPVSLSVGTNTITVLVTAQDGTTSQFYTITVTRAAGASTGYAAWIGNYPGLADATASGDPDHDGIPNLLEYVLNGNPGAASTAILPVVSKVAGNFVFTFSRRVASAQDTTQIFQYSSDLSHWTDVLITSPTDTRVALGTADANGIQSVTVTILAGTNASMFGRLQVTSIDQVVSGYAAWIATYPGLVDATASGDPDHDGIPNLLEYVLNGNPGIASSAILPSVTKVANNFVFTFSRRVVSEQDTTQIFQYSSDLSHWTDVSITGTKGTEVALGSADGAGVQPVTVTIPQGASPTMFGRLKVMQP